MAEEKTDKTEPAKKTASSKWGEGDVNLADLRAGTEDSDSVRRLQHALKVKVSGNYDEATRHAVQRWRLSNDLPAGRGSAVDEDQASAILGRDYTVVDE